MNKPASKSRIGGVIGREFEELRAAILALWPSSMDGQRVDVTTAGVRRRTDKTAAATAPVMLVDILQEGPDALLCREYGEGGATPFIVAKPHSLQQATYLPIVMTDHVEHAAYLRETAGVYEQTWLTGPIEFVRLVTHLVDDLQTEDRDAELVIHPPYRITPDLGDGTSVVSLSPMLACQMAAPILYVDPDTLAVGGSAAVSHLDLNIDARRWTTRREAQGAEKVTSDFTGLPLPVSLT